MMTCDCKNEIQEIDEFIKSSGYINRRDVENSGIVYRIRMLLLSPIQPYSSYLTDLFAERKFIMQIEIHGI